MYRVLGRVAMIFSRRKLLSASARFWPSLCENAADKA